MIPDEFAEKALEKLKLYGVKLNEKEYYEALEWLKTNYRNYGKSNYKHGYKDGVNDTTRELTGQNWK